MWFRSTRQYEWNTSSQRFTNLFLSVCVVSYVHKLSDFWRIDLFVFTENILTALNADNIKHSFNDSNKDTSF